ncbi:MAG: hypothetical protein ACREEL_11695 [Stellaceae bacterium]
MALALALALALAHKLKKSYRCNANRRSTLKFVVTGTDPRYEKALQASRPLGDDPSREP